MSTPNPVIGGITNMSEGPLDKLMGPYPDTAAANLAIPNNDIDGHSYREGKIALIGTATNFKQYAWQGGFDDIHLKQIVATKDEVTVAQNAAQSAGSAASAADSKAIAAQSSADALNLVGLLNGPMVNNSFNSLTVAGYGKITVNHTSGLGYAIQQLVSPINSGQNITVLYRIETGNTGATPRISTFKTGVVSTANRQSTIADGQWKLMKLTVNTDGTTHLYIDSNGASSFTLYYSVILGALDDTTSPTTIAQTFIQMAQVFSQPTLDSGLRDVGLLTGVAVNNSYTTFAAYGMGVIEATQTSAGGNNAATQPIKTGVIANNKSVTMLYRVIPRNGQTAVIGQPRVYLRNGAGTASASVSLNPDGGLGVAVLTATAADVNGLYWYTFNNIVDFRVEYALFLGTVDDASPALASFQSSVLSALVALSNNSATIRNVASNGGLLKGPLPASNSYASAVPVGMGEIELTVTGTGQNNTYIIPIVPGVLVNASKVSVLYCVLPRTGQTKVIGQPRISFTNSAGSSVSANFSMISDGLPRMTVMTMTGNAANFRFYNFNSLLDAKVYYAVFAGDTSETSPFLSPAVTALINSFKLITSSLSQFQVAENYTLTGKQPLIPRNMVFVSGRQTTFYPRNMLRQRALIQQVFMGFLCRGITNTVAPPIGDVMGRSYRFNPSDLITTSNTPFPNGAFTIEVRDKRNDLGKSVYKTTAFFVVPAAVNNTLQTFTMLGDSTSASTCESVVRKYNASGGTLQGIGTYKTGNTNAPYEGRSGSSWLNWFGFNRGEELDLGNTFLKSMPKAAIAGFSIDVKKLYSADNDPAFNGGVGYAPIGGTQRTSYYEDELAGTLKATYSIMDWAKWRDSATIQAVAATAGISFTSATKHIVTVQLGINDADAAMWALAARYCADNFKAAFPNGGIVFNQLSPLSGIANNGNGDVNWVDNYEPSIRAMIKTFDNATDFGNNIGIACSWFYMNPDHSWDTWNTSVDAETGVTTADMADYIHPQGVAGGQTSEALLPWVMYFKQKL